MNQNLNPARILLKGISLFLLAEFVFISLHPNLSFLNVYTTPQLMRSRFPASTHAPEDGALDVGNLDAMFASHIVSQPKADNEFRVLFLGDSSTWGFLLKPEQTLTGQINKLNLACGNKTVRAYNLSFPRSSATKDLMILDKAMKYQPDLIVWQVTLYTLEPKTRIDHWLVTQNRGEFYSLDARFHFLPQGYHPESLDSKIFGPQRSLFRVLNYQLYSFISLATGLDQIQTRYDVVSEDLTSDLHFEGLAPPTISPSQISIDQVKDFYQLAGNTPVILMNQPILIVTGQENSKLQYNASYPRWVYDQYRQILGDAARENGWNYLDPWDQFASKYFTNTPLHLNAQGEKILAQTITPTILKACP